MIPVRLKFKSIEDFLKTHSSDTALAGIFVATAIRVDAGTEVLLTIDIEGEDNLETQAIVHWYRDAQGRHEAGVGLRFVRPPSVLRRLIASASASDTVSASISADNSLTKKIGAGGGVHNSVTLQTTDTHRLRRPIADHQLDEPEIDVEVTAEELGDIPILGIDLGTSNSCAAIARGDQVHVVDLSGDNRSGSRAIPSVVFFPEEGSVLVGAKARAHQKKSPARTIFGSKRFVGRRYHHPDVQALLSRYPYKIVPGRGEQCAISLGGRIINLVTVSSKILGLIKERSEASLGRSIDQAVVTVPAHFNQNQRQAIVQAGKLAGLEVARIINEPTAAAIAYGLTYDKPATIIVYDLGGGTFDVSVMKIGPPNLTVLATGGDTFLGGEDFDQVIVDYVVRRYHAENRHGAKLSTNHIAVTKLKIEAEKVKCLLTTEAEAVFSVPDADLVGGGTDAVSIIIRRRDVEGLVEPLVTRTLKISDMVLRQAGLEASEIDDVLLVGGQTAMPCVAARVGKHFRRKPRCDLAADEVVALGAAMLSVISITSEMRLQDILSMSIGIHAGGGNFHKLIEANTPLPHRTTFRFTIPRADLQTRQLDVFQGESPQIIRNEKLGSVGFQKFAADTTDPVPLEVELLLSPDCLLRVRITNRATDEVLDELLSTKDSD